MGITTMEQAQQAFTTVLRGGGDDAGALIEALWRAERSVLLEAAAGLLVTEASVVLGEKGWAVDDCRRAVAGARALRGAHRTALGAAIQPSQPEMVAALLDQGDHDGYRLVLDVFEMLRFLRQLPRLAPLHPPGAATDGQARVHDKVRALLAKAESTTFEAEAEACTAKAQELMERHAIDEATLGDAGVASGLASSMRVGIEAPYARPKAVLLSTVARSNRCRTVYSDAYGFSTLFGAASDLWTVDLLYTSLLVQAGVALQREDERSRAFRHAFLLSFAHRIGERMRAATATAAAAAAAVATGDSFLPVLAAREDAAVAARDEAFPHLGPMRVSMSNSSGASAGRQAANRASLRRDSAIAGRTRGLGR